LALIDEVRIHQPVEIPGMRESILEGLATAVEERSEDAGW